MSVKRLNLNSAENNICAFDLGENLGFLLDKKVGVNQPKRIENARILIANTPMDADKVKVNAGICLYSPVTQISYELVSKFLT
jgi:hypothetical protein